MLIYRSFHPEKDHETLEQCGKPCSPYCYAKIIGELSDIPFGCVFLNNYRSAPSSMIWEFSGSASNPSYMYVYGTHTRVPISY